MRRSRSEIVFEILHAANGGATKTQILYRAYLSYAQACDYLDLMKENGLLYNDPVSNLYDLTDRGLSLLHLLEKLEALTQMPADVAKVTGGSQQEKHQPRYLDERKAIGAS